MKGLVIRTQSGFYTIFTEAGTLTCQLADLALTAKIHAYLLTYPGQRKANIQVDANQGTVRLSGIVSAAVSEDDVRSAVDLRCQGFERSRQILSVFPARSSVTDETRPCLYQRVCATVYLVNTRGGLTRYESGDGNNPLESMQFENKKEVMKMGQHLNQAIYGSLFMAALTLSACASSDQGKSAAAVRPAPSSAAQSRAGTPKPQGLASDNLRREQDRSSLDALRGGGAAATPSDSSMKEVYFDFDQYNLDNDDRATLRASADWLKKNPSARAQIEGHCDERGTNEYNLPLGAKRAQAAKDYLVSLANR